MRRYMFFLFVVIGTLQAHTPAEEAATFDQGGLDTFYNEYILEADESVADVQLTGPPTTSGFPLSDSCGALTPLPTIPALAQASSTLDLIPVVLINNSGLPDSDVFFVIYGFPITSCSTNPPTLGPQSFVSFGTAPGGPFTTTGTFVAATGPNAPLTETYSYLFDK